MTAWLLLPAQRGYYMNDDNAAETEVRFRDFQGWTAEHRLRWEAVGLDIEPDVRELAVLKQEGRLAVELASRPPLHGWPESKPREEGVREPAQGNPGERLSDPNLLLDVWLAWGQARKQASGHVREPGDWRSV